MSDRRLTIYWYNSSNPSFQFENSRRQAQVCVAAESQKRAAELFDCSPREIAEFGGVNGPEPTQKMCRAEPEVVFVEIEHGLYSRATELSDPSKRIKLDMRDPELYGIDIESSAFGVVGCSRFSGDTDMFMVDYPTGHGVALTISTAVLNRRGSTDRVMEGREIVRVEMSEVQWARMLSSPNAGMIPCTLRRFREPVTGEFLTPKMPEKHAADMDTFRDDVADRAKKALTDVTSARHRLDEIMKGPLRKGDLQEVIDLLSRAEREATANLPWVAERATETIQTAQEHAKAEIDAHIDYAMTRLGERALGDRLALAQSEGVDIAALGKGVAMLLAPPKED